jgi:DNA-binding NtrC family response regulator
VSTIRPGVLLEVLEGTRSLKRHSFHGRELTIGRNPANGLVLPDRSVSKHHARLLLTDDGPVLADLESAGGTFFKGQKVRSSPLSPGDEFRIGPYIIRLLPPDGIPPEPVSEPVPATSLAGLLPLTDLIGVTDLRALLETFLERIVVALAAARGFVVLVRDGTLEPILVRKGPAEDSAVFSRTICQQVVESRQPVLLTSRQHAGRLSVIASIGLETLGFVLAVPLIAGESVLGVLYLESPLPAPPELCQPRPLEEVSTIGGRALRAALERRQLVGENERWRSLAVEGEAGDPFSSARSPLMRNVRQLIQKVAAEDVTALILGESGTGKEVTAKAIHHASPRRGGPFVAINCGAIPRDLMEAELFGYERGAFTGADRSKSGRLELAQGGTLLLDEVGDMPRELQVKLLRALEARTFERLGGSEPVHLDARLLAATNRDLEEAIRKGEFREDLYYRLNVVSIRLPALRQRPEDIEPLVSGMLSAANLRFRRKLLGVAPDALRALEGYHWPGNVRELKNVIERAFIVESSDQITVACLPFHRAEGTAEPIAASADELPLIPLADFIAQQEINYVRRVLERVGNNVSQAARILGLARTALHRKLKHLGLRGDDDEP